MEALSAANRPQESHLSKACLDPSLAPLPSMIGQPVRVMAGPLAGLTGVVDRQVSDGRVLVEVDEWLPGASLCIDCSQLAGA